MSDKVSFLCKVLVNREAKLDGRMRDSQKPGNRSERNPELQNCKWPYGASSPGVMLGSVWGGCFSCQVPKGIFSFGSLCLKPYGKILIFPALWLKFNRDKNPKKFYLISNAACSPSPAHKVATLAQCKIKMNGGFITFQTPAEMWLFHVLTKVNNASLGFIRKSGLITLAGNQLSVQIKQGNADAIETTNND